MLGESSYTTATVPAWEKGIIHNVMMNMLTMTNLANEVAKRLTLL